MADVFCGFLLTVARCKHRMKSKFQTFSVIFKRYIEEMLGIVYSMDRNVRMLYITTYYYIIQALINGDKMN